MENYALISWIRKEIASTRVVLRREAVGYEEHLFPNPELFCCEFTDHPVTSDRQHIIVTEPVYADVPRAVLDETRAGAAADALVSLVLTDERYLYLAEELMGEQRVFSRHWESLCLHARDARTKNTALRHLGRASSRPLAKSAGRAAALLRPPLEFIGKFSAVICFYGTIIYLLWPNSKPGLWIGTIIKKILAEAKRMICG